MNQYIVQVLNDKEFDNLPYKGISDSLGIADKEKSLAFVRESGLGKEFDLITLTHEVNHLIETTKTDADEYGIMHKKGGAARFIVPAILGVLSGGLGLPLLLGTAISGIAGAGMGAYAGGKHPEELGGAGTGALTGGITGALSGMGGSALGAGAVKGATAAAPGFLSKAGGAITGGIGNLLGMTPSAGGAATTNALVGLPAASGQGLAPSAASTFGSIAPGASIAAINTQLLGNALSSGVGAGIGSQLAQTPKVATTAGQIAPAPVTPVTPASTIPTTTAAKPTWLQALSKKAGEYLTKPETLLGAGMTAASMLPKETTPYPEIDIESIRTSLLSGEGLSPLAQQARAQLSQIMSAKSGELYPTATDAYYTAALRQTRLAYQRAQESLAKRYNLIDPNYQQNGEYQELARRLDEELANVESDYSVTEEQRRFELSRTQQYEAIKTALAVDDAAMQELIGLTGLSITQAAAKYNVEETDVDELRKSLGGLGGELLSSGLGVKPSGGVTVNLGK